MTYFNPPPGTKIKEKRPFLLGPRLWLAFRLLPTGLFLKNGMIWPENAHIELGSNEKLASLNGRTWYHDD